MKPHFLLLLSFLVLSCSNDDGLPVIAACGVANPIEDLDWLETRVQELRDNVNEESQFFFVSQATFNNETVFIFDNCCPFCNTVSPVFNCSGELLGVLNDEVPEAELSNSQVVYRPNDFSCEFN